MGTGTGTGVETRGRTQDGNGNEDGIAECGRSARNHTKVVDAMWETGETWVEREKNVDNKGLVSVTANPDNLENTVARKQGGKHKVPGF